MRFSAVVAIVVVPGLLSLAGCSGPSTNGSRFRLPVFNAPEQWEPDLVDEDDEGLPES